MKKAKSDDKSRKILCNSDEIHRKSNEAINRLNREHKHAEEALRKSEEMYRSLVTAMAEGVCFHDAQGRITAVNPAAERIFGRTSEQMINCITGDPQFESIYEDGTPFPGELHPSMITLGTGEPQKNVVIGIHKPDGTLVWISINSQPLAAPGESRPYAVVTTFHDITVNKQSIDALIRLNRELRAISSCNQALLRAVDEKSLLDGICRIICDEAGYRMAWVGYAEHDSEKTVRPVAWAGFESGHIANTGFSWADDTECGQGPAGQAIRTGKIIVIQDFATDLHMEPWRESALQHGYRSAIIIPLKDERKEVFGVLLIYSAEINAITREEVGLMEELAGDLAFGITGLRTRMERDRIEAELRESEERYRFIAENTADTITVFDLNLKPRYVSSSVIKLSGYTVQEAMNITVDQALTPESLQKIERELSNQLALEANGKADLSRTVLLELEEYRKDGSIIWAEVSALFLRDSSQKPTGIITVARDITERKNLERERLANLIFFESMDKVNRAILEADNLESMMSNVLDRVLAVFQCDQAGLVYPCDPETASWQVPMERTRPEYPGALSLGSDLPMDPVTAEYFRMTRESKGPLKFGSAYGKMVSSQMDILQQQSIMGIAMYPKVGNAWVFSIQQCSYPRIWTTDEEKLFQEIGRRLSDALTSLLIYRDLQKSENFLNSILENIPDTIIVKDAKTLEFVRLNKSGENLLGYSRGEIIGKDVYDFLSKEKADFLSARDRQVISINKLVDIPEETVLKRNNEEVILHTKKIPIQDETGNTKYLLSISEDITDYKAARDFVRKFSKAIEQSPVSIIITDILGNIEFVNAKFTQITGYSYTEALRQNPRILKSGETKAEEYQHLWNTIISGGIWKGEFHNRKKNGELFWEQATISPIRNSVNVITHYLAIKEDITEKKLLEDQFRQAQKMELVGRLAGGVAHDFNNLLTVISGYTQLAMSDLRESDPLLENLNEIRLASDRASSLTRQLLAFSRTQVLELKVIDLNILINDMKKMLHRLIGEDIELIIKTADDLGWIKIDPGQMEQIILNLVVNARDAMPAGGKLIIETANVYLNEEYANNHLNVKQGNYVRLILGDTGSGMTPEVKSRIFEPFYTTKDKGKGTGLGLSTVYGIVNQNGGNIWVYSEPGKGTTFKIYFPRIDEAVNETRKKKYMDIPRGNETVLVVEDEEMVRKLAVQILKKQGYNVLAAFNSGEALLICEQQKEPIHLILTDVVMPMMNGPEFIERLKKVRQDFKTLFMSGYTEEMVIYHGVKEGEMDYIQKPFTHESLSIKIREVLDKRSDDPV